MAGFTGLFGTQFALAGIPIEHWTQPSGVQVYLVHSPAIPMVDVQIEFDAGARRDPVGQTGLAVATSRMMAKGIKAFQGKPAMDENQLGEAWADLGASFSANAGSDRLTFALRSLSYPDVLTQASALAARQLGEPAFPDKLWQRDRPKMIASIKEANTRPATVAARAYGKAVYGSHPYGRETTEADLNNISSADMQALHTQAVRACYARISMVGAVSRAQADALVATLLARLPQRAFRRRCTGPPGDGTQGSARCPSGNADPPPMSDQVSRPAAAPPLVLQPGRPPPSAAAADPRQRRHGIGAVDRRLPVGDHTGLCLHGGAGGCPKIRQGPRR